MKERTVALIFTLILLSAGVFAYYFQMGQFDFNFYNSELTIDENLVQETLLYRADQDYHTLYRNFQSSISDSGENFSNTIAILDVECEAGTPYFITADYRCYIDNSPTSSGCLPYTEANEYGCSFGNNYGFVKSGDYQISADYRINPENLFRIDGGYYIKFIAYSEDRHNNLVLGNNFIIHGEVIANKKYSYDEQVIIYIPYNGDISGFNIIEQAGFLFDSKLLEHLILLLMALAPGILFFGAWFFFGKENYEEDIPERLSMYPSKRKAWEVAAFFNQPFGSSNPNITPTLLSDFYHRKIIDIRIKDKDIYIKINGNYKGILDSTEKDFMNVLKLFEEMSKKNSDYFLLKSSEVGFNSQPLLVEKSRELSSGINKLKSRYLSSKGNIMLLPLFILTIFALSYSIFIGMFLFVAIIFISMVSAKSSLLIKFNDKHYAEYQKWQAFRKFLSDSSLKLHGHKGTIVWGEFLVYATALGEAKRVLKEMKAEGIISDQQYNAYTTMSSPIIVSSALGGFAPGSGGAGGGFGGAGGGGAGGGGGGGR